MIKFFFKFKKNLFLDHFPNFGGKIFFPKNRAAMHNLIRVSSTMAKSREQTLFHRILPATAGELTSTTAVDWHLKVKDKKCDVGLTKNYCITVSLQKITSIHKHIRQILGSHELNGHAHF